MSPPFQIDLEQDGQSGRTEDATHPLGTPRFSTSAVGAPGNGLLLVALVTGALTHGYHLFLYPLYITDEGIYMQRAWAVIRAGALAPYTYNYAHAPAGGLVIAAWFSLLPRQFQTFGDAINAGRVLMLLVHLASVYLLFQVARRLSGSTLAAFDAPFFFNVSPLAIFYQRQVVLDNLMVFWVLLSVCLATSDDGRVLTPILSGAAFGIAVLTKENAIFFIPALSYLLFGQVRPRLNRRFARGLAMFAAVAIVSEYFLYAVLKNELLPAHLNFNLSTPPTGHAGLLYTIWQQLHRNQGSIFDTHSLVWRFSLGAWLPKDTFLLVVGTTSTLINLVWGLQDRRRRQGELIAALLASGYLLYLMRGSVVLEFYVVPLIPFLAINMGLLGRSLLQTLSSRVVVLHDSRPSYRLAHSHFEVTGDPAVRDKLFARDWTNVDYIVMSSQMLVTMQQSNTAHQYDWIFEALNHAQRIWVLQLGGIELEVWRVQHRMSRDRSSVRHCSSGP